MGMECFSISLCLNFFHVFVSHLYVFGEVSVHVFCPFLDTNSETEEKEIKESTPFTIAPNTIRYLGINLTKEVKDPYSRSYRTLMKEIEEDTKRWKHIPHGLEE